MQNDNSTPVTPVSSNSNPGDNALSPNAPPPPSMMPQPSDSVPPVILTPKAQTVSEEVVPAKIVDEEPIVYPTATQPVLPINNPPVEPAAAAQTAAQTPAVPAASVASTTPTTPKKPVSKVVRIVVIVIAAIITIILLGILLFVFWGNNYFKHNFVPGISPLIEDYISSPSEQLQLKAGNTLDAIAYLVPDFPHVYGTDISADYTKDDITKSNPNLAALGNFAENINLNIDTELTIDYTLAQSPTSVFGLSAVKGEATNKVDDQIFNDMLAAKEGEIVLGLTNVVDFTDKQYPTTDSTTGIDFVAAGKTLSVSAETITNKEHVFYKISDFPENPYFDLTSIIGNWYQFDNSNSLVGSLALLPYVAGIETFSGDATSPTLDVKRDEFTKLKKYLATPTAVANISVYQGDMFKQAEFKCYQMSFNETNYHTWLAEVDGVNVSYDPTYTTSSDDFSQIPGDVKVIFCFDRQTSFPKAMGFESTITRDGNEVSFKITSILSDFGKTVSITEPADALDFKTIDLEKISPSLAGYAVQLRDQSRVSMASQIRTNLETFKTNTGAYPKLSEIKLTTTSIGFGSTIIPLDGHLSAASVTSASGTAYCIKYDADGVAVVATQQEDGIIFSLSAGAGECALSDFLAPSELTDLGN